jgi:hypothetical protein
MGAEHSVRQQVTKLRLGPSVHDAMNGEMQVGAWVDVVRDSCVRATSRTPDEMDGCIGSDVYKQLSPCGTSGGASTSCTKISGPVGTLEVPQAAHQVARVTNPAMRSRSVIASPTQVAARGRHRYRHCQIFSSRHPELDCRN